MNLNAMIRHATREELDAILSLRDRVDALPAIVVTIMRKRYVVDQSDEHEFEEGRPYMFGGRWLRSYGRVDEMHRLLSGGDVTKIERIERKKVWGG